MTWSYQTSCDVCLILNSKKYPKRLDEQINILFNAVYSAVKMLRFAKFSVVLVVFALAFAKEASPQTYSLPPGQGVLAEFNFDGNTNDSSGNGRNAILLGGTFVTRHGGALQVEPSSKRAQVGIDWSAYANLLRHPYSIEIILEPKQTGPWGKIFGFSDSSDNGWYYKNGGFQSYPKPVMGAGTFSPGGLHYLAFVSISPTQIEVFHQGQSQGTTDAMFTAPPQEALFFSDDTATGRREQLSVFVYALRISLGNYSGKDIGANWFEIQNQK